VHARLLTRSRESGEDFQFLLQRYAAERFLYRLGETRHRDRYVLKGAALFAIWGSATYRGTRDLDFTGYGSSKIDGVLAAMGDVCGASVADDGITFDATTLTARPIREEAEYSGLRVQFQARLGAARIPMQVDIGFGNAIEPPPSEEDYPTLLDMPAPRIRAYPQEAVVAEKLHAMVVLGERNSRYKDFYDLYVFARQFPFDGQRLATAIAATFERRRTAIDAGLPAALTPRFYSDGGRAAQWRAYLARNSLPGAPADWIAVGELLQVFLSQPYRAIADGRTFSNRWSAGGPWAAPATQETAVPEIAQCTLRRFNAYSRYKNSGIEWLGEIPAHWEVAPVYARYEVALGKMLDAKRVTGEFSGSYLRNVDVQWDAVNIEGLPTMDFAPWERDRYLLRPGDLLVCEGGEVGRTAIWRAQIEECFYQKAIHRVRPRTAEDVPRFFYYLMYALAKQGVFAAGGNPNTIDHLTAVQLRRYRLPFAAPQEQRVIATFLDREAAIIDALVAKKEQLIALLQERRTELITRAVTKGLDPNAPMKDSGIEWFTEIPAHWEPVRVKHLLLDKISGPFGSSLTKDSYGGSTYRVYGQEQVIPGDFTVGDYYIPESKFLTMTRYAVQTGDVLLSCVGSFGRAVVVPEDIEPGIINPRLILLRPNQKLVVPEYLELFLKSEVCFSEIDEFSRGGTMDIINLSVISALSMPLPPKSEQRRILAAIRLEVSRLSGLIGQVREAIESLKELRTALISAAVTGKIDVREEAV